MSDVRFAFLGCGRVSNRYIEVFTDEIRGGRVVGCCDLVAAKAEAAAKRLGGEARAFTDVDAMLDEAKPDVVCVLSESGNHYRHARHLLERGVNVVVEKPVTMIPGQAYELAALAESKGLMLTVVKQNRWNPAIRKLKETMEAGRFGRIVTSTFRLRWCRMQEYYEDGWHGTWAMDGGVINQQAIHHVDALNWICGPVESVCAAAERRANVLEAEDTMVGILRFSNGALGTIEATTAARPQDFEASLSVVGEKGMVVIGGIALNEIQTWTFVEKLPGDDEVPALHSQMVPTGYGLGHGPYLNEVARRLAAGNRTPVLSAQDGVKAQELVHAFYASIERNGWVDLASRPQSERLGR